MDVLKRAALVVVLGSACVPTLEDRSSLVSAPRVLAVAATPAEAPPGATVTYAALYADPAGGGSSAPAEWDFCDDPASLDQSEPVSPRCFAASGAWLVPIGDGSTVTGPLPDDGCRLFGPTPPDPMPGQPAPRPVDPDATGGYYQPLRLAVTTSAASEYVMFRDRITCGVSGATREQSADYTSRIRPNVNPLVMSLVDMTTGSAVSLDDGSAPLPVHAGQTLSLRVSWPACPSTGVCGDGICGDDETDTLCSADCATPKGCAGAEHFVLFDLASRSVVRAREGIRVSWFATAGDFAQERTAAPADPAAPSSSDNAWTAPATPGDVRLWVTLRDDRGGAGWQSYRLSVGN